MTFFEPDPVLVAFLFIKKFLYLEVLVVLALVRVVVGRGLARWPALVAFVLAVGGVATVFAPAAGLNEGPVYVFAAQTMAGGGGMAALLVPSIVFLVSSVLPNARWRLLDVLHGMMLLGLLGLWWWTS